MQRERRRFERIESPVTIKYLSKTGHISGFSLAKDVSEGGVGLPLNGKVPRGMRLRLIITIVLEDDGSINIPAVAKVMWSKRNTEHWKSRYSAGLKFVKIAARDKERLLEYVRTHRWIKSDFERALEENKVPVLGGRGEFLIG